MSSIPNPVTTRWIPLQGDSREHLAYWGTYEISRTYNDGDCAIGADGILYMCTKNGTTTAPVIWPKRAGLAGPIGPQGPQGLGMPLPVLDGTWLKGVGGAAVWSPLTVADILNALNKPSYGITLPSSPVDGQEHILVNSVTAPTWSWRCRYNAGSTSSYKWEVAGPSLVQNEYTQVQIGLNTWTAISTINIVVPRPGIYVCQASCRSLATTPGSTWLGMMYNNAPGSPFGPVPIYTSGPGLWTSMYIAQFQATFPNAGDLVGITGHCSLAPGYYDQLAWSIKPVRIS